MTRTLTLLEHVHATLREQITSGEIAIGERLPTTAEIAQTFGCSVGIASKAIAMLVQSGLVEQRRKLGTRVINNGNVQPVQTLQLDAVAIVYPSDQHEGTWRTLQGFSSAARAVERRTMMLASGMDFRKEAEIIGRLSEFDVKGAVLYPVITNPTDEIYYRQMILSCRFPVVLVELNLLGVRRSSVVSDGLHAGYTMTRHLLDKGCEKIGFVTNYSWAPYMRDRYLGYRQAMDEAGLSAEHSLLEAEMRPNFRDPLKDNLSIARTFLKKFRNLEAAVCATDFLGWSLIEAAREEGRRVPEDFKVVGIDDYAQRRNEGTGLTTYHIPYEEMGRHAFQLLNEEIGDAALPNRELQLRGHVVVRESDAA